MSFLKENTLSFAKSIIVMNKVYYLSSCDTCKRILNTLKLPKDFILQDIKTEAVSPEQLQEMKHYAGTYEALLNKRARLYQQQGLSGKSLSEDDIKALILSHYTFLKRPVILTKDSIFIGNSKKVIADAKHAIHE